MLPVRKQVRPDLDHAFLLAPDKVRLLRIHCQPPERLRHYSTRLQNLYPRIYCRQPEEKIPSGRAMLQEKAHHDGRPGAL